MYALIYSSKTQDSQTDIANNAFLCVVMTRAQNGAESNAQYTKYCPWLQRNNDIFAQQRRRATFATKVTAYLRSFLRRFYYFKSLGIVSTTLK